MRGRLHRESAASQTAHVRVRALCTRSRHASPGCLGLLAVARFVATPAACTGTMQRVATMVRFVVSMSANDCSATPPDSVARKIVSASTGSLLTSLLFTPLDVIKTRMQAPGQSLQGDGGSMTRTFLRVGTCARAQGVGCHHARSSNPQNASLLVSRVEHGVPGCWRGQGLLHRVNTFHGVRLTTCDGAVAPCAAAA